MLKRAIRRIYSGVAGRGLHILSPDCRADLIRSKDTFLFDCDGVLWRGDTAVDGAADTIQYLRDNGKRVFFITNSSLKSRSGYKEKFDRLSIPADMNEIICSSYAAALHLKMQGFSNSSKKAYVIGEQGICEELSLAGIQYIGGPSEADKVITLSPGLLIATDPHVKAVVVGCDRYFNYYKLQYAQLCLNNDPECEFVATNSDHTKHLTPSQEWVGAGAMVGAVIGCTNRQPNLVGKPSSFIINYIASKHNLDLTKVCMIGDRLDTDVLFGRRNGLTTMLVLSGVTTLQMVHNGNNKIFPDYIASSVADIVSMGHS
jgi:phosphoglycolate phosphatase